MKKNNDPTISDIKRILAEELGYSKTSLAVNGWYNDKRAYGRRIKVPLDIDFDVFEDLEWLLRDKFPNHRFAIGHHFWRTWFSLWMTSEPQRCTVIHVRNKLQKEAEDTPKEVKLTLEEIAKLANCEVSELQIVDSK